MNRLDALLLSARGAQPKPRKLLVTYFCAGYPSEAESIALAAAAVDAGADIVEWGVPFSDPTADGPVIAAASQVAIGQGMTLDRALDSAKTLRGKVPAPIVLFGYYNPVFTFGEVRFAERARASGVDALLLVDLPPEEAGMLREELTQREIALIPLITPTTTPVRAKTIFGLVPTSPKGFAYAVSVTGVTGGRATASLTGASAFAAKTGTEFSMPVVVGFGIAEPEDVQAALSTPSPFLSGVVVGSALARDIASGADEAARRLAVVTRVQRLRQALDAI